MRSRFVMVATFALAACAAQLPAAATAASPGEPTFLTGPQIQKSVIGTVLGSTSHSGKKYTMLLKADGTGMATFGGSTTDPLTWDINADVLCFHGKLSGTECNRVKPNAAGYDFFDQASGKLNNAYTRG